MTRDAKSTLVYGLSYQLEHGIYEQRQMQDFECVRNADLEVLSHSSDRASVSREGGACAAVGDDLGSVPLTEDALDTFAKMAGAGWF